MTGRRWARRLTEVIPPWLRQGWRAFQREHRLQAVRSGTLDWGGLRRTTPISGVFGLDRGTPIDRYYIEQYLATHMTDIQESVLEIGDDRYTRRFGAGQVTHSDVLNLVAGNPKATILADLARPETLPASRFDCILVTQTLQMIYEIRAAIRGLHRLLKPGGILLVTSHGLSRIARREGIDDWGEYWHLTAQSAKHLFEECFPPDSIQVRTYGNVLAATAFLHGLAAEELTPAELDYHDPNYELLVAVRAVRPSTG